MYPSCCARHLFFSDPISLFLLVWDPVTHLLFSSYLPPPCICNPELAKLLYRPLEQTVHQVRTQDPVDQLQGKDLREGWVRGKCGASNTGVVQRSIYDQN